MVFVHGFVECFAFLGENGFSVLEVCVGIVNFFMRIISKYTEKTASVNQYARHGFLPFSFFSKFSTLCVCVCVCV